MLDYFNNHTKFIKIIRLNLIDTIYSITSFYVIAHLYQTTQERANNQINEHLQFVPFNNSRPKFPLLLSKPSYNQQLIQRLKVAKKKYDKSVSYSWISRILSVRNLFKMK